MAGLDGGGVKIVTSNDRVERSRARRERDVPPRGRGAIVIPHHQGPTYQPSISIFHGDDGHRGAGDGGNRGRSQQRAARGGAARGGADARERQAKGDGDTQTRSPHVLGVVCVNAMQWCACYSLDWQGGRMKKTERVSGRPRSLTSRNPRRPVFFFFSFPSFPYVPSPPSSHTTPMTAPPQASSSCAGVAGAAGGSPPPAGAAELPPPAPACAEAAARFSSGDRCGGRLAACGRAQCEGVGGGGVGRHTLTQTSAAHLPPFSTETAPRPTWRRWRPSSRSRSCLTDTWCVCVSLEEGMRVAGREREARKQN